MNAERLGVALESSNLKWSDHATKDIDLVTAVGFTKPTLGVLLIRAYVSNDHKAVKDAVLLATEKSASYMKGVAHGMRQRICSAAVYEFLSPMCRPCGGTGKALQGQKWTVCPKCNGTMLKRHSDGERARSIGVDTMGAWTKHYSAVMDRLHSDYHTATYRARERLR